MKQLSDEALFRVGGVLHEARMEECYGNMQLAYRKAWPKDLKEFRAQRHAGQPWIDVAIAQVRTLQKQGTVLATLDDVLAATRAKNGR